jgi:hypothetical protein
MVDNVAAPQQTTTESTSRCNDSTMESTSDASWKAKAVKRIRVQMEQIEKLQAEVAEARDEARCNAEASAAAQAHASDLEDQLQKAQAAAVAVTAEATVARQDAAEQCRVTEMAEAELVRLRDATAEQAAALEAVHKEKGELIRALEAAKAAGAEEEALQAQAAAASVKVQAEAMATTATAELQGALRAAEAAVEEAEAATAAAKAEATAAQQEAAEQHAIATRAEAELERLRDATAEPVTATAAVALDSESSVACVSSDEVSATEQRALLEARAARAVVLEADLQQVKQRAVKKIRVLEERITQLQGEMEQQARAAKQQAEQQAQVAKEQAEQQVRAAKLQAEEASVARVGAETALTQEQASAVRLREELGASRAEVEASRAAVEVSRAELETNKAELAELLRGRGEVEDLHAQVALQMQQVARDWPSHDQQPTRPSQPHHMTSSPRDHHNPTT